MKKKQLWALIALTTLVLTPILFLIYHLEGVKMTTPVDIGDTDDDSTGETPHQSGGWKCEGREGATQFDHDRVVCECYWQN